MGSIKSIFIEYGFKKIHLMFTLSVLFGSIAFAVFIRYLSLFERKRKKEINGKSKFWILTWIVILIALSAYTGAPVLDKLIGLMGKGKVEFSNLSLGLVALTFAALTGIAVKITRDNLSDMREAHGKWKNDEKVIRDEIKDWKKDKENFHNELDAWVKEKNEYVENTKAFQEKLGKLDENEFKPLKKKQEELNITIAHHAFCQRTLLDFSKAIQLTSVGTQYQQRVLALPSLLELYLAQSSNELIKVLNEIQIQRSCWKEINPEGKKFIENLSKSHGDIKVKEKAGELLKDLDKI